MSKFWQEVILQDPTELENQPMKDENFQPDTSTQLLQTVAFLVHINTRQCILSWIKSLPESVDDKSAEIYTLKLLGLTWDEVGAVVGLCERQCRRRSQEVKAALQRSLRNVV
jgi:DNA-directed RNA polymerase specialized sigma24 family protein